MTLPPKDHPIWTIATVLAFFAGIGLIQWVNAKSFDGDEIVRWVESLALYAGVQMARAKMGGSEK